MLLSLLLTHGLSMQDCRWAEQVRRMPCLHNGSCLSLGIAMLPPCMPMLRLSISSFPSNQLLQRAPDKAESVELPQRRLSPLRPADSYAQMNEAMRVSRCCCVPLLQSSHAEMPCQQHVGRGHAGSLMCGALQEERHDLWV